MQNFIGEALIALAGLILVVGGVLWNYIDAKSKNIGARIGKTETENAELGKEVVALKTENKNLRERISVAEARVAKAEERDERWVCKNDLKELKASINTRFDKLETAIKESKQ